ncbi:MAG: solute carrier family 23 protein [Acholeplasma sp.]|nr:solute carrier family 23 protein [Acholeplasma sp.]
MQKFKKVVTGYLPDERPSFMKLVLFALQHILVMFPATVLVALLTGFHISTTIFASGFATLCFILVTKGKIPLYYGSSFSYIAAIVGITGAQYGQVASNDLIGQAQFGIMMSGLVSIGVGLLITKFGANKIEKVLPPVVTGPIAMIIGLSLAGTAMNQAAGFGESNPGGISGYWVVSIVTLLSIIVFTVMLKKGVLSQLPILFGILLGYATALILDFGFGVELIDYSKVLSSTVVSVPHFTLPVASFQAVAAIMPIALATIPESTAHLYQLDLYVNNLALEKGVSKYEIESKLGLNLVGDGIGDIASALVGGPAGTNYGENISTMAITKNFSVWVLGTAAIITMILAFVTPLANLVYTIPQPVIGGASIYLFGVIGAQGIAILIEKKVNMFEAKNLGIIAVILIVGLGGNYAFPNGNIPMFGFSLPALAFASILGILLNLLLNFVEKYTN